MGLHEWTLLIAQAICQFGAEVFVVKNYAFCVIFTTPLALLMGNAVTEPLDYVVVSRTAEVGLSILFGLLALWLIGRNASAREHARLVKRSFNQMGAVLGALTTSTAREAAVERRDLQYELLSERRAIQSLAETNRPAAEAHWDQHVRIQQAGYRVLDYCHAHGRVTSEGFDSLVQAVRTAK